MIILFTTRPSNCVMLTRYDHTTPCITSVTCATHVTHATCEIRESQTFYKPRMSPNETLLMLLTIVTIVTPGVHAPRGSGAAKAARLVMRWRYTMGAQTETEETCRNEGSNGNVRRAYSRCNDRHEHHAWTRNTCDEETSPYLFGQQSQSGNARFNGHNRAARSHRVHRPDSERIRPHYQFK